MQEICKDAPERETTASKKLSYFRRLDALEDRISSLVLIDQSCARKCILDTRKLVKVSNSPIRRILTMYGDEKFWKHGFHLLSCIPLMY